MFLSALQAEQDVFLYHLGPCPKLYSLRPSAYDNRNHEGKYAEGKTIKLSQELAQVAEEQANYTDDEMTLALKSINK